MPSSPLRLEDFAEPKGIKGHWTWMQATDTSVTLAVENAHPEADYDDEGYCGTFIEHDGLMIYEDGALRKATDEEEDEYGDDVRRYLRACDWSN